MRVKKAVAPLLALLLPLAALGGGEDPGGKWFTDVAAGVGLEGVGAKRTKLMDFTGDGWPDVLVMCQDGAEWRKRHPDASAEDARKHRFYLYRSEPVKGGGRRFVDVTEESGLHCGRPVPSAREPESSSRFSDSEASLLGTLQVRGQTT